MKLKNVIMPIDRAFEIWQFYLSSNYNDMLSSRQFNWKSEFVFFTISRKLNFTFGDFIEFLKFQGYRVY